MQPESVNVQAQMEALRARAFGNVGYQGIGAEKANTLDITNPLAQEGLAPTQTSQKPSVEGGAGGISSQGAMGQLKQEKGESRLILEALIARLRGLTKTETASLTPQPTV